VTLTKYASPKKVARALAASTTYVLSKMAFHLLPASVTRFTREKGFAIKPYHLHAKQLELSRQARGYLIDCNQEKIRVYEWGAGPVMLLVHGWGGRALQLNAFIPALVQSGFKVVAFDHKGHGESSTTFSSYLEIVKGTYFLAEKYEADLYGIVAHSIGSNAAFKTSEKFARKLKIAAIAPVENFPQWLEKKRKRIGIYEQLFANVIAQIEAETGLKLLEQSEMDFARIAAHDVLLVHDKFDRISKISASHGLQANLPESVLMETEKLGHARILDNAAVVDRVLAHFAQVKSY
jgi:pimeloyl-ACP methyl ester carboxylesterase